MLQKNEKENQNPFHLQYIWELITSPSELRAINVWKLVNLNGINFKDIGGVGDDDYITLKTDERRFDHLEWMTSMKESGNATEERRFNERSRTLNPSKS